MAAHSHRASVNNTTDPLREKGNRLQRVRAVYSVKSALSVEGLKLTSPLCSKPIFSKHIHASFLFILRKWESAQWHQQHTHTHTHIKLLSSLSAVLFHSNAIPSFKQPTFICSVVNSLAVKLKDWLWCLSSFYLLPWFIFISAMKGRMEWHPVPLFVWDKQISLQNPKTYHLVWVIPLFLKGIATLLY